MTTAFLALAIVQAVISIILVGLVLMQRGKGADAGASFGAGASGTVFGARGSANFLSRATAIMATFFFANCLALAYLTTQQSSAGGSVVTDEVEVVQDEADASIDSSDLMIEDIPVLDEADESIDAASEAVDAVIEDTADLVDEAEAQIDAASDETPGDE